jgi:hypothetical protein
MYRVEISNRFAALKDVHESVDINIAWESTIENIKTSRPLGYHKLKRDKPWSDDECPKLIDQQNKTKLQWLQNQRKSMEIICKI